MVTDKYIEVSKKWVKEFIIANDICPFAKPVFEDDKVGWKILSLQANFDAILEKEALILVNEEHNAFETKFLIIPQLQLLDDFLEVFYFFEEMLEIKSLGVKLVAFHPAMQFGEEDAEAAVNYATRSPFPMIQLLKNERLDALSLTEEGKDLILTRNEELLESKGIKELRKILNEYRITDK